MFARAIDRLELTYLQAHRYGLRHGGASHDLLSRRHTLLDVKHKGRSATDGSLKRYAKATRLQKEMDKLPWETLALGNSVEDHFAELMASKARGLPLPTAGARSGDLAAGKLRLGPCLASTPRGRHARCLLVRKEPSRCSTCQVWRAFILGSSTSRTLT